MKEKDMVGIDDFWSGVTTNEDRPLTEKEKLDFISDFVRSLETSPELAKIFFNTQVYNVIENDVTTRGGHSEGVAIVAENLARIKAQIDNKSVTEQQLSGLLAKSLGYMHDLGHTPFGHDGEGALGTEMERFDATDDYKNKRKELFGEDYTKAAGDTEVEVMCYEHNETSSFIGASLLKEFARKKEIKLSDGAVQYIKTGILAHSTSRVEKEPNGNEQKAVRLADKVAYIPQDLLDLLKQGVITVDELTPDELGLLGINPEQLTLKEQEQVELLKTQEEKDKYMSKVAKTKSRKIEILSNLDELDKDSKLDFFRVLDLDVQQMQAEIATKCFVDGKLDGKKDLIDELASDELDKNKKLDPLYVEGRNLFVDLTNAQALPETNQEQIQTKKEAVRAAAEAYKTYLVDSRSLNPTMASLWVTKAKYQDAFIHGDLTRISTQGDKLQRETLGDINKRNENAWRMKITFQYFYAHMDQIPDTIKAKYMDKDGKSVYTEQQIVSAFIASFTNEGLNNLYQGLLANELIISRSDAIDAIKEAQPGLDADKLFEKGHKWKDPQDPEKKLKIAGNDFVEYAYETYVGASIVAGKDEIEGREPIPQVRHIITVKDVLESRKDKSIQAPALLKGAVTVSKEKVTATDVKGMVTSILEKQDKEEIKTHIQKAEAKQQSSQDGR